MRNQDVGVLFSSQLFCRDSRAVSNHQALASFQFLHVRFKTEGLEGPSLGRWFHEDVLL